MSHKTYPLIVRILIAVFILATPQSVTMASSNDKVMKQLENGGSFEFDGEYVEFYAKCKGTLTISVDRINKKKGFALYNDENGGVRNFTATRKGQKFQFGISKGRHSIEIIDGDSKGYSLTLSLKANSSGQSALKRKYPNISIATVKTKAQLKNAYYGALYKAIKKHKSSYKILMITTGNDPDAVYLAGDINFTKISSVIVIKGKFDWTSVLEPTADKFSNYCMKKAISEKDTNMEYRLIYPWTCSSIFGNKDDFYGDSYHYIKDEYSFSYCGETKKQEKAVDKKIKKVLKSLNLKGKSRYYKTKKIHDYVVKTLSYDYTYKRHNAYQGLVHKKHKVVCEGYSQIMFKMLNAAGVPCHVVCGYAGLPHAWNIVKIGEKWYHLDATFDDTTNSKYGYFLVGSKQIKKDHQYSMSDQKWLKSYKISKKNYK